MASKLNPVTIVLRGVDRVTGTVSKVSTRLKAMQAPVRGLSKAFSELNKNSGFSKVMDKAQGVGTSFARLARNALFAGSALGFAAVAGMKKFVSSADQLDEAANAAGVTVEKLQELRFAAARAGVPAEKLDSMLRRFSVSLGQAKLGTGSLTTTLKKNAPALLKQLKAAKSTGEAFDLFMDAADRAKDPAIRNALLSAGFGKTGSALGPVLGTIVALGQEAHETGNVMSSETVAAAVELADASERVESRVTGLAMVFASELLPPLLKIVKKVEEWMKANQELLKAKVIDFAHQVAEGVQQLAGWLVDVVPKVIEFVDNIGGMKAVLASLALVITGPLIASIVALSVALVATPFGWVILAISTLILGVAALAFYWDEITGAVGRFANKVRSIPGLSQFGKEAPWATEAFSGRPSVASGFQPGSRNTHSTGEFTFVFEGANPRLQQSKAPAGIDFTFKTGMSMPPGR